MIFDNAFSLYLGYQQEHAQSGSSQFALGPDVNVFGLKWTDDWDTAVGNKYERDVSSGKLLKKLNQAKTNVCPTLVGKSCALVDFSSP